MFVFFILIVFFLNCVICQMDLFVIEIRDVVFLGTCTDVALSVPISFYYSVDTC